MIDQLERRYPWIPWRRPVKVIRTDGVERWACRLCIGKYGLKGKDVEHLYGSPEAVHEHLVSFHQDGG